MNTNLVVLLFFFFIFTPYVNANSVTSVYSLKSQSLSKKASHFDFLFDYFKTTGHYDYNGNYIQQKGQESFNRTDFKFQVGHFLNNEFEIFGGANVRNNNSIVDRSDAGTIRDQSTFGFESINLGMKYYFRPLHKISYSFEFETDYRTFSNNAPKVTDPNDPLILGDDGYSFKLGPNVDYQFSSNFILATSAYYHIPNREQSHEVLYDLHLAWIPFSSLGFIMGLDGIYSMKNDGFTKDPQNKPPLNTGATYMYNSVNREMQMPYVGVNWAIKDNFRVELSAGEVVGGTSYDEGMMYKLGLIFTTPGKSIREEKIEKFKVYETEANIVKVSPKGVYVKLDKGVSGDIEKGMKIDFFDIDYLGGNVLIATGIVTEANASTSIVKIIEVYNSGTLKEGMLARAYE